MVVAPPAAAVFLEQTDLGRLECTPTCTQVGSGRQTQANCVYVERMSNGYIYTRRGNVELRALFWMFCPGSRIELSFSFNFGTRARGTRVLNPLWLRLSKTDISTMNCIPTRERGC